MFKKIWRIIFATFAGLFSGSLIYYINNYFGLNNSFNLLLAVLFGLIFGLISGLLTIRGVKLTRPKLW